MPSLADHVRTSNLLFASRDTLQTRIRSTEKQVASMAHELDDAWRYAQKLEARLNEVEAERDSANSHAKAQKELARFQDAAIRELLLENERLKRTMGIARRPVA